MILWGVPFYQPEMPGQGFFFPKLPKLETKDVGILQRDGQELKKQRNYSPRDSFLGDTKDYEKKALAKYDGYTYVVPANEADGLP